MIKGIQLVFIVLLSSSWAMAGTTDRLISICQQLGGAYEIVERSYDQQNNKNCYKIKCSLSENADQVTVAELKQSFPGGSGSFVGGWKDYCEDAKSDEDIIRDATGGSYTIEGRGQVSYDVWAAICGEDGSRCRLDGGVWVQLGGNGNGNGNNGNGNNGNGNGSRNGGGYYTHVEGNTRFRCASDQSIEDCIGNDANIIVSRHGGGRDCVDCSSGGRRGGAYGVLSGVAEVAGAVLPPVMGYLGVRAQSDAYLGANQAWAGAAGTGFEQCQLMQSNYVDGYYNNVQNQRDYVSSNSLPDQTFETEPGSMPNCNGYQLNQFAGGMGFMGNGMGGFGNPWGAAGYSPGFMGGM
ncbi:MAG: hypothetical protein WD025_00380, partial [Bacteriovoracaceae bacterium]